MICISGSMRQKFNSAWEALTQSNIRHQGPDNPPVVISLKISASNESFFMSITLLVMRHAEKSPDLNDPYLTAAGEQRAKSLATYIPEQFGKPDFIFATANSMHS